MVAEGGGDDNSNSQSSFAAARVACQHSPDLRRARMGLQVEMRKDHPMIPTHTPEPPSGALGAGNNPSLQAFRAALVSRAGSGMARNPGCHASRTGQHNDLGLDWRRPQVCGSLPVRRDCIRRRRPGPGIIHETIPRNDQERDGIDSR